MGVTKITGWRLALLAGALLGPLVPGGCSDSTARSVHIEPRPKAVAPGAGSDPQTAPARSPQGYFLYDR